MTARFDDTLNPRLETERRYEVIEMHLSDTNAVVPKALCGADTAHDLRDLKGYLEDRLYEVPVGTVCQDCKALAMPHAEVILEAMTPGEPSAEGCPFQSDSLAPATRGARPGCYGTILTGFRLEASHRLAPIRQSMATRSSLLAPLRRVRLARPRTPSTNPAAGDRASAPRCLRLPPSARMRRTC